MSFLPQQKHVHTISEEEIVAAQLLLKILRSAKRITKSFKITSWGKTIHQMVNSDKVPLSEIMTVLHWYEKHWNGTFVPKVYSAVSFRVKYARLVDCIHKSDPIVLRPSITKMPIMIHGIMEHLKPLDWPKGNQGQVRELIWFSYDNLKYFQKKLKELHTKALKKKITTVTIVNFMNFVLVQLTGMEMILVNHVKQVHKRVCDWSNFSGSLMLFELKLNSTEMENLGRSWGYAYNCDPNLWDNMLLVYQEWIAEHK